MNLYKLLTLHAGPKSSNTAILRYFAASSDEEVFEELKNEAYWQYDIEEWEESENEDKGEHPKTLLIRNRGNLNDENWDDAYYGIFKWGWELVGPITDEEIETLKKLKVLD